MFVGVGGCWWVLVGVSGCWRVLAGVGGCLWVFLGVLVGFGCLKEKTLPPPPILS